MSHSLTQAHLDAAARYTNRKSGRGNNMRLVTEAQLQGYTQYLAGASALLHLPRAVPLVIQDAQGNFPYMPGLDGPVNPE